MMFRTYTNLSPGQPQCWSWTTIRDRSICAGPQHVRVVVWPSAPQDRGPPLSTNALARGSLRHQQPVSLLSEPKVAVDDLQRRVELLGGEILVGQHPGHSLCGSGWTHRAGVRAGPARGSTGPASAPAGGVLLSPARAAGVHRAGRQAAPARDLGSGGQDCPKGRDPHVGRDL